MLIVSIIMMIFTTGIVNSAAISDPFGLDLALGNIISDIVPISDSRLYQTASGGILPSSVDLSESESFPCVRSQGSIASCTAWATTYYQFGYQVASMNSWNAKYDTTKQFSPKWTYNFINAGINNGSDLDDAYRLLKLQGAVRYSEFTPSKIETEAECKEWCLDKDAIKSALLYRVSDSKCLSFADTTLKTPIKSSNAVCLEIMKSLLNSGKVLTFSTDFKDWDYQQLSNQYMTELNNQYVCIKQVNNDGQKQGHAMAIVGYDDNITYDLDGDGIIQDYEKGAFKIVNSHGKDYGNDGFIWVMYDALNKKSNAKNQNLSARQPIFLEYSYYVITVESYPLDLVAEVTITQSHRDHFFVALGSSPVEKLEPVQSVNTMFSSFSVGSYNFSGLSNTAMKSTFVFDFGKLCNYNIVRKNYYIIVEDSEVTDGYTPTIIDEIKLIDSTGKVVVDDTERKVIRAGSMDYRYKIGMVGDVDNDGIVSISDATQLQKYMAGIVDCSKDDIIVADVNNDGYADINDVTYIQKYIVGLVSEFENGHFSLLS